MTVTERIDINPRVMLGKPVIRGTRMMVELILRKMSEGASGADLMEAYLASPATTSTQGCGTLPDTLAHEEMVFIGESGERQDDILIRESDSGQGVGD